MVHLVDAIGNPQLHAMDLITGRLLSSATGDLSEVQFSASPVSQLGQSEYTVSYTPAHPGQYVFAIFVNGQPLSNSPFTVTILRMYKSIPNLNPKILPFFPFCFPLFSLRDQSFAQHYVWTRNSKCSRLSRGALSLLHRPIFLPLLRITCLNLYLDLVRHPIEN